MTSDDMKACRFVLNLEKKRRKETKTLPQPGFEPRTLGKRRWKFCIAPLIADALSSRPRRKLIQVAQIKLYKFITQLQSAERGHVYLCLWYNCVYGLNEVNRFKNNFIFLMKANYPKKRHNKEFQHISWIFKMSRGKNNVGRKIWS